jgi:5,10-methylenetetrahydrofolate reductase
MDFLSALRSGQPVYSAELRPPRAELEGADGMNAWIDTYHAIRRLTKKDTYVFLTDSAVGAAEEDNLRHLTTNLGRDVPRTRIVPFMTTKHPLDYCLAYAERARQSGFPALVVLGGDKSVGTPRCVPHAWQLRQIIREQNPALTLGGWANPHDDASRQLDFVMAPHFTAEFFLTQVVSHHDAAALTRFLEVARDRGLTLPGVFGVFYYRSASPKTLQILKSFLPVPVDALTREFEQGASPEEICARTLRCLAELGARHFYISNLPIGRAATVMASILERAGLAKPA